jgi:hypothetical protein
MWYALAFAAGLSAGLFLNWRNWRALAVYIEAARVDREAFAKMREAYHVARDANQTLWDTNKTLWALLTSDKVQH